MQLPRQTKLSQHLQIKSIFIQQTLIKLGCPLVPTSLNFDTQSMDLFFQPTDTRLQLLEWLIATLCPGYKLDPQYKNCYDDDPHLHKIKRLGLILWQLGVMPVSKFTKNLDYDKYVEGVLGQESAINLIYDLTQLAESKFAPNIDKLQQISGDLLGDLIRHNTELVNVNYQPYGVTFPSKYLKKNDPGAENDVKEMYQNMLEQLKDVRVENGQQRQQVKQNELEQSERLLEQLQTYKQLFSRKYTKLSKSIDLIIQKYSKVVPTQRINEVSQLHEKRTLKISKSLCKEYRAYKKLIGEVEQQGWDGNLKQRKKQILTLISNINQVQF